MAYNALNKLRNNNAALEIAINWKDGDSLSEQDLSALKLYSGFGGIKAVLFPKGTEQEWIAVGATKHDLRLHEEMMRFHRLIEDNYTAEQYKSILQSVKHSVLSAFYTPEFLPEALYDVFNSLELKPKNIYEPSAGAGIFVTNAVNQLQSLEMVTAVEKDILTAKVLQAMSSQMEKPVIVHNCGLEETSADDQGNYDLVVSNIPFGNYSVWDPSLPGDEFTSRIHNYFFVKALDKVADGGIVAFITTEAVLNAEGNKFVREYIFRNADFISLAVLPDNLMHDTGNTMAPTHLLILQKNAKKNTLTNSENRLIDTKVLENKFGSYTVNSYLLNNAADITLGNRIELGKNQYGRAARTVIQEGNLEGIAIQLKAILTSGMRSKLDFEKFNNITYQAKFPENSVRQQLTFLEIPVSKSQEISALQLGLFDALPPETANRAFAYLTDSDQNIKRETARLIARLSTTVHPEHESIVVLTARRKNPANFVYKVFSNIAEVECAIRWLNASELSTQMTDVKAKLQGYGYNILYQGDDELKNTIVLTSNESVEFTDVKPYYKEGMLLINNGRLGTLSNVALELNSAKFTELPDQRNFQFYMDYVALRDQYLVLTVTPGDGKRIALNQAYDSFTTRYGQLNARKNSRLLLADEAFGFQLKVSLERRQGDDFVKSDLFAIEQDQKEPELLTTDVFDILARSLNDYGNLNMDFIIAKSGLNESDVIEKLDGHIYFNPVVKTWETADKFLSGNVVEKLVEVETAYGNDSTNEHLKHSFEALKSIQPEIIVFELLDLNLGERWIPVRYFEQFASELFETPIDIHYLPSLDLFKVVSKVKNAKIKDEFAVTPKQGNTMFGTSLLEHALVNTTPFFTYEVTVGDNRKIRVPDNEAIQTGNDKIEKIRTRFTEWLKELPLADKKTIEDIYNKTFNCYVLRDFNGSHLNFKGLDLGGLGIPDLYASQKNAAWRVIQNRGALIDHEVGLGKTLTMIVSAMEMKRLGIVSKPVILALKSNVIEISQTFRTAYPNARLLTTRPEDFTPKNRVRLFHEIKNNNWDAVVMTHDQFGKIPQSAAIQVSILQAELDNVERDLDTLNELEDDGNKQMLKGLQIRQNNLSGRLKATYAEISQGKDSGIDFNEIGIDHLFVDESHKFKNLTFTTRHTRVAGIGNTQGSYKALNLLFAIRELQQRFDSDLCATFLSGTPISNSLTEMYLIFKYLRPKEMERQRIQNFDAWAAVFTKKIADFEFSVTNEIIAKERLIFIKVPELALFYNDITDYKTAAQINLDRPEIEERMVSLDPTPDQEEFIVKLMEFARTGNGELIGRSDLTKEERKARMLIATDCAKKMSVDMRLIDPSYPDHPNNKLSTCARDVARVFIETQHFKGTQLIFCDIGTPNTKGFNVYQALKDKLTDDFNIPQSQIAFIHDWEGKRKKELFKLFNNGDIRILIGSTEKLGTGTNVQRLVVETYDLDIPWTPKDLRQRDGRGARKGNIAAKKYRKNKVGKTIYATKKSLDAYKFNLLKYKQTFIGQMKNSQLKVRTIDEGTLDENSGMNYSEYIAILSGDTSLLEKSKIEKKIAVLESLKSIHFKECAASKLKLAALETQKSKFSEVLDKLHIDGDRYQSVLKRTKDGHKENPLNLLEFSGKEPVAAGEHLLRIYHTWNKGKNVEDVKMQIGSLYGFNLYIKRASGIKVDEMRQHYYYNTFYAESSVTGLKYTSNNGLPNLDNPAVAARFFLNAIDRIAPLMEKYKKDIAEIDNNIPVLAAMIDRKFDREAELEDLKCELKKLQRQIQTNIQKHLLLNAITDESKEIQVGSAETKIVQMVNNEETIMLEGEQQARGKRIRLKSS